MRQTKEATERKNEILDAATELFIVKGYDGTSTTDILDKIGIARGTLYYHFKSKEEILDALIDRIIENQVSKMKAAIASHKTAVKQLASFIAAMRVDSPISEEIASEAHKPQNALMHQKMQGKLLASIMPIATSIIKNGIAEGDFSTKHPEDTAEMLLVYSSIAFDDLSDLDVNTRRKKISGLIYNMERLLGMQEGSLSSLRKVIR